MAKCIDCGGEVLHGDQLHETTVTEYVRGGKVRTRVESRCKDCMETYASAMWPEDEWGPYPHEIHSKGGRA